MLTVVALIGVGASTSSSSFVDGDVFIAGSIGAIITALGAYLIKRRSSSGSVETSDAGVLWTEGQSIRKYLAETLDKEREEHRQEREAMQATITNLENRSLNDRREIAQQERRINMMEQMLRNNGLEVPL
jgi:uncharacterized membrane protein YccC